MTIRFATNKDLKEIKDLLLQVNNVHAEGRPDIFIKDKTKFTDEEIIALLKDKNNIIFAYADENDKLVGYAFCHEKEQENSNNMVPVKTLYIFDLCVEEKHRHQHIGQTLLKHVEKWAKENAFYNIELNVWECNPSAKAFYQRMGLSALKTTLEKKL